jgi:hypothetical protein
MLLKYNSISQLCTSGLPDFSGCGYTKRPQNIPNGCKIDQMAINYTNIFHCKALQNLPKVGFSV